MDPEKVCVDKFLAMWEACHAVKNDTPGPNIDQQICYTIVRMDYQACLVDLKANGHRKG
jgi:hypothetical protein